MSFGLQTWDESGNTLLDPNKRISRYLGSFNTGTSPGSFSIPGDVPAGQLFFYTQGSTGDVRASYPNVVMSGTSFSWSFSPFELDQGRSYNVSVTVHYGVY